MARKAEEHTASVGVSPTVNLRYIGDGEYVIGYPADGSVEVEMDAPTAERLVATGLYEVVGEQEDKTE